MDHQESLSNDQVIALLAKSNSERYNYLKCIEELAELQEVLIKKINKQGGPKEPSRDSIVEEIGDVLIRLKVLSTVLNAKGDVNDRVNMKCKKFAGYLQNGMYAGSI